MARRWILLAAAVALAGFAAPSGAEAQALIFVQGGATFPTGDYGDYAKTGWMAAGGVLFPVGPEGLSIGAEGFFGQNNHKDVLDYETGAKTTPYGAMAVLSYGFQTGSRVTPYVFGGAGLLVHRYSSDVTDAETDTKFGYEFGAGLDYPVAEKVSIYAEGRYMGSEYTKFFGIFGGFAFVVGD